MMKGEHWGACDNDSLPYRESQCSYSSASSSHPFRGEYVLRAVLDGKESIGGDGDGATSDPAELCDELITDSPSSFPPLDLRP